MLGGGGGGGEGSDHLIKYQFIKNSFQGAAAEGGGARSDGDLYIWRGEGERGGRYNVYNY